MSTTVDQRVVEMRFDNRDFENNVKTTMSTLQRLKQSLNLTGASKGFENLDAAAKKVDMSGLSNSVETVQMRFSALDVFATTALANIANSAYHTGVKMLKALTVDPITTGFQEYETQINAVQTILANTSHAGTDINDVNKALEELNKYADQTIYNFTEMTRNIGTFTAAGVDLDTSTAAIKGIANLAAVSGSTSQQASTAMYQLSQALAAGKVGLQDWNSVVNAGMGGKVFQDALIRTAAAMEGVTEETFRAQRIGTSFRESLNAKGGPSWLSSDVLTKTLKQFTMSAKEGSEEWKAYKKTLMEVDGYTEAQATEILKMANTATDAATKVKTFTQLWDVLKESAQSGWSQTWKLVVGDFEEAKALLSPLAAVLTGMIDRMSDFRNSIIKIAFDNPFSDLVEKINKVTEATKTVKEATQSYGEVVDKVLGGEYGSGQSRWDKLSEDGYDWAKVQNMINERLGSSVRHTEKMVEAQDKQNESQATTIEQLMKMSDEQLKNTGFTKKEIEAFRELEEQSKKTGLTMKEIMDNPELLSGRSLFLEGLKNAASGLKTTLTLLKRAWLDAFPDTGNVNKIASVVYDALAAFHKFSLSLRVTDKGAGRINETGKKLLRTFKGIFAIVDVITTIFGGGFKIAIKTISKLLGYFDMDLLSVTAKAGDAAVAFRDWFEKMFDISKVLDIVVPIVERAVKGFTDWMSSIKETTAFTRFVDILSEMKHLFVDWFEGLKDLESFKDIPRYILDGLINGLKNIGSELWNSAVELGQTIINAFCDILGIHSPSTKFFQFGIDIIMGLVNGIAAAIKWVFDKIQYLGTSIVNFFKNIDFSGLNETLSGPFSKFRELLGKFDYSKLLGLIPLGIVAIVVKKIYDISKALGDGINNFNDILEGFADIEKQFAKVLGALKFKIYGEALKEFAISLAILVAALVVLTHISDTDKLGQAIGTMAIMAGIMVALAWALHRVSKASVKLDGSTKSIDIKGIQSGLTAIGIAVLLMAATVKMLGGMTSDEIGQGLTGLTYLAVALVGLFAAYGRLVKGKSAQSIGKAAIFILAVTALAYVMIKLSEMLQGITWPDLGKAAAFVAGIGVFVAGLLWATQLAGNKIDKVGGLVLKISIAMLLMIAVCKLVSKLDPSEMFNGVFFGIGFVAFIKVLTDVVKMEKGTEIAKLGGLLLSISVSMLLMLAVCKLAGKLQFEDVLNGAMVMAMFLIFTKALVSVTTIGNDQKIAKVAATMIAMTVAIGLLAGMAIILGLVPIKQLAKGVAAVTLLGLVMTAMIWATRGAQKCVGNLVVMTLAIAVMAAAVGALSMLDLGAVAVATLCIGALMGLFAIIMKVSSTAKSGLGSLIVITIAIAMIGGVVYLLAKLPIESVFGVAASISVLLIAMGVSLALLGTLGPKSIVGIGALGLMTLVVMALGLVLNELQDLDVEKSLEITKIILLFIGGLSAICLLLTVVGAFGPAAIIGIGSLIALIASMGILAGGIGVLVNKFPELETFLDKGIPILDKIGRGIGSFIGNLVGGFTEGLLGDSLPKLGENLSGFMTNLGGFIEDSKTIDSSALTGATNLIEILGLMAGVTILDKIASMFGDENHMEKFSTNLSAFADALRDFSDKVSGNIDEGAIEAASNAASIMVAFQKDLYGTGGVIQWFCGEKDMGAFGEQLITFGEAIVEFSKVVSGENAINEEAVKAAASAGQIMITFQKDLCGTGGVIQWFCGEKDMAKFGKQLVSFGKAIVEFSNVVSVEGTINLEAIQAARDAGLLMTELQATIVPTDGVWQFFAGNRDFANFGGQLVRFGEALVDFSEIVKGNIDEDAVDTANRVGTMMATLQAAIPTDKWFDGKISLDDFGDKIVDFGACLAKYSEKVADMDTSMAYRTLNVSRKIIEVLGLTTEIDPSGVDNFRAKDIGKELKGYYDKAEGVDPELVNASVDNVYRLINLIKTMSGIDATGAEAFKAGMDSLCAVDVNAFAAAFSQELPDLSYIGSGFIDSLLIGMKARQQSIASFGSTIITQLANGISDRKPIVIATMNHLMTSLLTLMLENKELFNDAGTKLIKEFRLGIAGSKNEIVEAATSPVDIALATIRARYVSFYLAGNYLVSGFVNGINDNIEAAAAAAASMAMIAVAAAEAALGIASPSKVFYGIGGFAGQGFVNALYGYASVAYSAASEMANSARNGLNDVMKKTVDTISGNMDMQPTIRPILDLSDVTHGTKTLSGLFGSGHSIGVMTNVGAIGTVMNSRQNGGNSDLISAIHDLKGSISKVGGNTYNSINGITYDDGSNIATAIKMIANAALVEGRA